MTSKEFIQKYKDQIEAGLKVASERYLKSGNFETSPRWFNTHGIEDFFEDEGAEAFHWVIKSTQCPSGFTVLVEKADAELYQYKLFHTMWDEFKRFRTQWLEENYPQIPRY